MKDEIVNYTRLAAYLNVSASHIYSKIERGEIPKPTHKLGRSFYWYKSELVEAGVMK